MHVYYKLYIIFIIMIRKYNNMNNKLISEGLSYHIENGLGVDNNIFRPGSTKFFNLFCEVRNLYNEGRYSLNSEEEYYILETDLGEWGLYEDELVPLDFPIVEEEHYSGELLSERKKKKKKSKKKKSGNYYKGRKVTINKPRRGGKSGKFYVYVKKPETGNIIKVEFGAKGMTTKLNDPERVKSFIARHRCKTHAKDKTKASYWSCRLPRYIGNSGKKWW